MPAPAAPDRVDGIVLTSAQHRRLQDLVDVIWQDAPERPDDEILEHARGAFRLTVQRRGGTWVDLARTRLNGGRGPIVRLRSAAA